jgi:hypothetical protein
VLIHRFNLFHKQRITTPKNKTSFWISIPIKNFETSIEQGTGSKVNGGVAATAEMTAKCTLNRSKYPVKSKISSGMEQYECGIDERIVKKEHKMKNIKTQAIFS